MKQWRGAVDSVNLLNNEDEVSNRDCARGLVVTAGRARVLLHDA
jgi:hypothetical protein